jgi:hypothetical protein
MTTQEIDKLKIHISNMNMKELDEFLENESDHYSSYSSLYGYTHNIHWNDKANKSIFEKIYDYFNINFKNKSILDLGVGSGESLDVAKDRGAAKMEFIDRDVIIARYNELKGYTGYVFDYTTTAINNFNIKYDIIISKGAFNSDYLNEHKHQVLFKNIVDWIENITNEFIIIIPTFSQKNKYTYESYEIFIKSEFSENLLSRGFKTAFIEGCNDEKFFPITFYNNYK